MKPIFSMEYPLRACDFDCRYQLQPAGVMDLFQDAAGRHAMELGIGYPQLAPQNKMWIISGLQYEVLATPHMYQTVRVVTWPLAASAVTCRREYRIEALDGTPLVKGTSDWAIMDGEKRKLLRAREIYPAGLAFSEELAIDGKMPRLRDFEPAGEGLTFTPGFSQLDMNNHVNNTKYANYILDAASLQPREHIKVFQIHYSKELLAGQPVTMYIDRQEKTLLAMGKNSQGETMFSGRIELM